MGADLVAPPEPGQVLTPAPGRGVLWSAPIDLLTSGGAVRASGLTLLHIDATTRPQLHRLRLVTPSGDASDTGVSAAGGPRRFAVAFASRPDDLDDAEKFLGEGSWRLCALPDARLARSAEVGYDVRVYVQADRP